MLLSDLHIKYKKCFKHKSFKNKLSINKIYNIKFSLFQYYNSK